jgi:hypothetical protein
MVVKVAEILTIGGRGSMVELELPKIHRYLAEFFELDITCEPQ